MQLDMEIMLLKIEDTDFVIAVVYLSLQLSLIICL